MKPTKVFVNVKLPELAHAAEAHVVIVNVDMAGQLRPGDRVAHLTGTSGEVLPRLTAEVWRSNA